MIKEESYLHYCFSVQEVSLVVASDSTTNVDLLIGGLFCTSINIQICFVIENR